MRKTLANDGMEVIYDLRADTDRVEAMKAVSKDEARPDMGLAPKPYLIGSRKFWRHLGSDRLPLAAVTGTITEVYWASMGDYPMFKLTEAGQPGRFDASNTGFRSRASATTNSGVSSITSGTG